MPNKAVHKKPVLYASAAIVSSLLIWTFFFYNDTHLKDALWEIHGIYISTLVAFLMIRLAMNEFYLDLLKVFIRTLFRVWLLIFITLAIMQSMSRVGMILSITFIFGYFEGLLDIDKWLKQEHIIQKLPAFNLTYNKLNNALATLFFMAFVHIFCALVIKAFEVFYLG